MRLLVGIHLLAAVPEDLHRGKVFVEFVKRNFEADPKTFFVLFGWRTFSKEKMLSLAKEAGLPAERFLLVETPNAKNGGWDTSFKGYSKNFNKVIEGLSKKLAPKETVSVVSFGSSAKGCYERISKAVIGVLSKRFGKRLVKAQTTLPWVYGRPEPPKAKAKKRFRRIIKILKHRKRV